MPLADRLFGYRRRHISKLNAAMAAARRQAAPSEQTLANARRPRSAEQEVSDVCKNRTILAAWRPSPGPTKRTRTWRRQSHRRSGDRWYATRTTTDAGMSLAKSEGRTRARMRLDIGRSTRCRCVRAKVSQWTNTPACSRRRTTPTIGPAKRRLRSSQRPGGQRLVCRAGTQ